MRTSNIVVKVASRCNLNCTYCYMYNKGDSSYLKQPKFMSSKTVDNLLNRVHNHMIKHQLKHFTIVFHGGEPLLAGEDFFINFAKKAQEKTLNGGVIDFAMQTNGVLLNENWCRLLKDLNIQVGVSLDGTPAANDQNRIYHNGKGSYNDILSGIQAVKKVFGDNKVGIISVINVNESPIQVYQHLKKLNAYAASFLFPDDNYAHGKNVFNSDRVGDWLIQLFDIWREDKDEVKPLIKPFDTLITLMLAQVQASNELFGRGFNDTIVIETDGGIEPVDTLKACGEGFTKMGLNVENNELDELFEVSKLAQDYYFCHQDSRLCDKCRKCPIVDICGGGFLVHRFSKENDFNNPTIYCSEIMKLVSHIQNTLLDTIPSEIVESTGMSKMNYKEIFDYVYL